MKVAIIFDRFGPYHIARLEATAKYVDLYPIEVSSTTSEYQWEEVQSKVLTNRKTLFNQPSSEIPVSDLEVGLSNYLDTIKPDVVAINGWFDKAALIALAWCKRTTTRAIVMSDSTAIDSERNFVKELIKGQIVRLFESGFVAGSRHADYLVSLGMAKENIFSGYDVVDNQFFEANSLKIKERPEYWKKRTGLSKNFFLVVSRFIEKKNLPFLIRSYQVYLKKAKEHAWNLLILGDGQQKQALVDLIGQLELTDHIRLEGFKQYSELPIYFGLAKALIHASTSEQWGLVVNEAMASGLPVIVSERCGCVPELVHQEKNGYKFDPYNQEELANLLLLVSQDEQTVERMGIESKKIIKDFNPDSFGLGLSNAAKKARAVRQKKPSVFSKLLLKTLIRK